MIVCQNRFWSEWKISLNVPYEDIAGNTRLIQGGIEILKKVGQALCVIVKLYLNYWPSST